MNWIGRLDVIVLALMLIYMVAVVTCVYCRYRLARRARGIDSAGRRKLAADLSIEVYTLKSIASTAPYLGLAGTCVGLLSLFEAVVMERGTVLPMMVSKTATAFLTTAAGILVAIPATCFYNYLRTRVDLLESEVSNGALAQRSRYFQVARGFPLTKRFSGPPAFALIAAPGLAILVAAYMTFASFHTPMGLPVRLVKVGVLETGHFSVEPIVIEIIGTSENGRPACLCELKENTVGRPRGQTTKRPESSPTVASVRPSRE